MRLSERNFRRGVRTLNFRCPWGHKIPPIMFDHVMVGGLRIISSDKISTLFS